MAKARAIVKRRKAVQNIRHTNLVGQLSAGRTGAHCWIARELVVP